MRTSKILFCVTFLALFTATCFAQDIDKTTQTYQRTTKRFVRVLNEQWGIDPERISGETYFLRDFGADAVDIMELVMALEEEFDLEIPDEEWAGVTTVNSAVEFILEKQDRSSFWTDRF